MKIHQSLECASHNNKNRPMYRVIVEHPHSNFFRTDGHGDGSSSRRRLMPMIWRWNDWMIERRRWWTNDVLLDDRRWAGQHLHDVTILTRFVDTIGLMRQRTRRKWRLRPNITSRSCQKYTYLIVIFSYEFRQHKRYVSMRHFLVAPFQKRRIKTDVAFFFSFFSPMILIRTYKKTTTNVDT